MNLLGPPIEPNIGQLGPTAEETTQAVTSFTEPNYYPKDDYGKNICQL